MKTILISCIAIFALAASSCGGGGGDGEDATNISGLWRGSLTKTSDSCTVASPATITISHQVTQNEDAVTLVAESGVQFLGNTVGDNGFSVNAAHQTVGSASCQDSSEIEYDSINDDSDTTADIDIRITRTCGSSSACSVVLTGTVSRSPSSVPTPTGTISGTPTPVNTIIATGSCANMSPNPAAGTYSGDGRCGISDTSLSLQNNLVLLEPFGANGATSFAINTVNPASAASQRSDLTVAEDTGYSCSLTCSPPNTFTVQCFKEGGTTCVEKF